MEKACDWYEDDESVWSTGCGNKFVLGTGTPAQNKMKFCCYCGKYLIEHEYEPEDDDEEIR